MWSGRQRRSWGFQRRLVCLFFFFSSRRRHTRFDCDWSSDVCSSDLAVFFEDVRVPRDHLVGERGMGFYYAMMALDFERIMIGSVGMIRRMLDELIAFVRRTRRDGKPLGSVAWVRRALADLEMRVEVGRQIGLLNAWLIDQGEVPTKEGSIAKVYVSELNAHLASVGMEVLGLAGQLAPDDPAAPLAGRLQWLYTTAPMQRFGGGTNEIQRAIIAQRGLGLPRK